jgi:hypothetical protein
MRFRVRPTPKIPERRVRHPCQGRPNGTSLRSDDALASVRVKLSEDEMALLEELYVPHVVVGFD